MNKFRKKIVLPIALILVGCCVVVSFVLHDSLTKVDANVAFNGISNIIDSHSENVPFNIVEVVPDKEQASLGYLIAGQEPENWKKKISTIVGTDGASGKEAREKYMSDLKDKLSSITTTNNDNTAPLYYTDYEESYINGGDDWTLIDLAKTEQLSPDKIQGYAMQETVGGDYNFETEYIPAVTDNTPSGQYNQNIDHYVYIENQDSDTTNDDAGTAVTVSSRGYYGVIFKATEIPAGSSAVDYFNPAKTDDAQLDAETSINANDNRKAYKVKSAYAIVSQTRMTAIAKYDPHASIYSVDNSDINSPYVYVGQAEQFNSESEENDTYQLDFEKYTYYSLEMEYVPADEVVNGMVYYEVDEEQGHNGYIFYEDQSGEYGAVLDVDEPYIKVSDDNSEYKEMGYFDIKEGSQVYNYVGAGNGSYNLVESDNGKLDYPLNISKIYIKGGFKNNDWFRNGVFNQDASDKSKDMQFNVQVVTPKEMDNINWSNVNLLYINGGDGSASFSRENDISWMTMLNVAKRTHESGFMMPVIADYSLINNYVTQQWNLGNDGNCTNLQRLVAILACSNYDDINIDSVDTTGNNVWAIQWGNLKFDNKVDGTHENGFVNGNIYIIPANKTAEAPFLIKNFSKALTQSTEDDSTFLKDAQNIGFGEIAEYINAENKIRKTENDANTGTKYAYFDKKISKDIILSYIISYANKRNISNPMDSINILDIEPGTVSTTNENALTVQDIQNWLGSNYPGDDKVTITRMTSSEFIGKIEDLNNYDMIYMGLVCDNNYKDKNGNTIYNDTDMNGLIYTNVGDIVVVDSSNYMNGHAGLLENDYLHDGNGNRTGLDTTLVDKTQVDNKTYARSINTYRVSGNDITNEKKKALENYVTAGFPIVLGNGIISNSKVNDYYIDNCSVIYELFNEIKDKENVFTVNNDKTLSKNLYNTLTTEKPQINLKDMDKVSGYDYVEIKSSKISFEFTISNNGGVDDNALFDVSLLLDANSDGKFSATQEKIPANDFKLYKNGEYVTPEADADGNYYYSVNSGNMTYRLEYDLPDDYVGIIPWKLKVSQATNEYRYDSESGYFYRENTGNEKVSIKILQINTDGTKPSSPSRLNMQTNGTFQNLIKDLKDFKLDIKTISGSDYESAYKDKYLDEYDMIVLGFSDCYSLNNQNGCLDGIKAFIKSGKPVLFTHDTTSFSNDSVGENIWGYDFNKIIRSDVGMDRYAVQYNEGLQSGETLTEDDNALVLVNGKYKTKGELFKEAQEYAVNNSTDIAYEPRSNKKVIVRQNQGFTYLSLGKYQVRNWEHGYYMAYTGYNKGNQFLAYSAEQVNSGQITTYPFKISDPLTIVQTHRQYYQLDLNQDSDKDGESDIVVWYTLSGDGYNSSPHDVRNNYYIYTMGNVTYSGVGHSNVTNDGEMKLYINTLIAAYNSGVHAPKVSVTESSADDAKDLSTIYVTVDDAIDAENNGDNAVVDGTTATKDIYFSIKDTNIVRLHKSTAVYADFCLSVTEDEYNKGINGEDGRNKDDYLMVDDGNGGSIYLKKTDIDVTAANPVRASSDVKMSALASGIKYKATIPLSLLPKGQNSITLYVVGHSSITKYASDGSTGETVDTSYAYKTIQIQRIGLSDLD